MQRTFRLELSRSCLVAHRRHSVASADVIVVGGGAGGGGSGSAPRTSTILAPGKRSSTLRTSGCAPTPRKLLVAARARSVSRSVGALAPAASVTIQRSPVHSASGATDLRDRRRGAVDQRKLDAPGSKRARRTSPRAPSPRRCRAWRGRARRHPRSAPGAARRDGAARCGQGALAAPARAEADPRRRGDGRTRRRTGRRRPGPQRAGGGFAAFGQAAQRILRRRQIGGVGEADQRHLGGGERARRILHVLDALEQDLPGAGQRPERRASRRVRRRGAARSR